MTPDEYKAFGLTQAEGDDLSEWILQRVGYVLGSNGRGGSGVFVETPNGRTALLTARHVLVPAILSGDITVGHFLSGKARSIEPTALTMSRHADAALVFVSDRLQIAAKLPASDWDPRIATDVTKGFGAILAGAPGEWKSEPNVERRAIDFMKTLLYWTAVTDPNDRGLVVCDVDESNAELPSSFKGMSGGPAFDLRRRLLGVNMGERRTKTDGIIVVTPKPSWTDLFYPFELPAGAPEIFGQRMACLALDARDADPRGDQKPVRVTFVAEFFRSPSQPDHQYGIFGRVICVLFGATPKVTRLPREH